MTVNIDSFSLWPFKKVYAQIKEITDIVDLGNHVIIKMDSSTSLNGTICELLSHFKTPHHAKPGEYFCWLQVKSDIDGNDKELYANIGKQKETKSPTAK